jgi:L-asparaginase/beta-aspartyl-peptidase (threonine type)
VEALIVAHGGVGGRAGDSDGPQKAVRKAIRLLREGLPAIEVTALACAVLEDDPRFNAGTGSVFRINGIIEMDAALMDSDGNMGAVAAIREVKNPILVALEVVNSPHVLLVGEGATAFARSRGFDAYNPATDKARQRLAQVREIIKEGKFKYFRRQWKRHRKYAISLQNTLCDTVGVVVRDYEGNFAAANSTGGISLALPGRVGDSAFFGCGLWAGPAGAVAATGIGEEIIRTFLSKAVYDLICEGHHPQEACQWGVELVGKDFPTGVIAVSHENIGMYASRQMPVASKHSRRRRKSKS